MTTMLSFWSETDDAIWAIQYAPDLKPSPLITLPGFHGQCIQKKIYTHKWFTQHINMSHYIQFMSLANTVCKLDVLTQHVMQTQIVVNRLDLNIMKDLGVQ